MRKCTRKSCRKELPTKANSDKWQERGFCGIDCMAGHGNDKAMASRERAQATERKKAREARAAERKAYNAAKRARKEAIKTRSEWAREAQQAVNAYVRIRDAGKPCVSCDKPDDGSHQRHASHYRSVGACSGLRFNLKNIFASCQQCNAVKSGNLLEYRIRLRARYGDDLVEWLESQNGTVRYSIDYLKRLRDVFRKRVAIMKKRQQ